MKKFFLLILVTISCLVKAATIYIDPTNTASGQNGSITKPYDSWTDVALSNGNTYLQKRGTVYTSSSQIYVTAHSVKIGAYGLGDRPVFSYTGSGIAIRISTSYCYIDDIEINGNGNAWALIGFMGDIGNYGQHNKVNNCLLYNAHNTNNAGFGVYGMYNLAPKILNTEIRNVALDGIYTAYTPGIEIGYCKIHDINRRYFLNANQTYSSGDGIQLDGQYNGFWLHHTTVDRTNGAGNKFDVILASKVGVSNNATGIIEYCTFKTDGNVSTALQIEMGRGIIIRHNTFLGITQGIRLGGAFTSNNHIYGNTFTNCSSGIGVGYKYPKIGPATGTRIYNNRFENISVYHIWVDKSSIEICGNIHDNSGITLYNYGGGSWKTMTDCEK